LAATVVTVVEVTVVEVVDVEVVDVEVVDVEVVDAGVLVVGASTVVGGATAEVVPAIAPVDAAVDEQADSHNNTDASATLRRRRGTMPDTDCDPRGRGPGRNRALG
jgi:hypothetical protein